MTTRCKIDHVQIFREFTGNIWKCTRMLLKYLIQEFTTTFGIDLGQLKGHVQQINCRPGNLQNTVLRCKNYINI